MRMRAVVSPFVGMVLCCAALAEEKPAPPSPPPEPLPPGQVAPAPAAEIRVREIRYQAKLTDAEARMAVDLEIEVQGTGEGRLPLFEGELAVLPADLPSQLRLVREGNRYSLVANRAGREQFALELVVKITRNEPWNQITFLGPDAVIASVAAAATGPGIELQMLSGTVLESQRQGQTARVRGFLGPERSVSLRWQSQAAEITRPALLTCETAAEVQVTPTVLKYTTRLAYEVVQGRSARLTLRLPAAQALTKLQGDQVRDWQIKTEGDQQTLTVEFIRPIEKSYALNLFSEQSVPTAGATMMVSPPQPLEIEREAGTLTVTAEDVLVETETVNGLRQINAPAGALAAYQYYARPFQLALKLRRIEPVLNVADRVTVRLEETRLLILHALALQVEKAGIYALEFTPPADRVVAEVRGEGIEDWRASDGKLTVNFNSRVLGARALEVQLERGLRATPEKIEIEPLRMTGAAKETAQIGAAAAPGFQLKTAADGLTGLREVPISRLANRSDEILAYHAEQPDWKLVLAAEKLAARITADVFNLVTIGDGLVGGSATIRLAIINQGVQEFQVQVPSHWKNLDFTGPNIRRKEQQGELWTIGLQDKAWGGYTLVVTYDFAFDPHQATLALGGAHVEGVERETGSIAVTSAANLQLKVATAPDPLRRIDESELAPNDRALINRPVLISFYYTGPTYELAVEVTRFEELPVLEAVADRTQLTTVLTEAGQMLTQASFMVKNNDKQYQSFALPAGADFWACYVRGQPVKPERTSKGVIVPLPRGLNRDEAFPVDIVYAQKIGALKSIKPRRIALAAPATDVQTTYAEWELFVPTTERLAGFGGNMIIARGTTYGLRDAWREFISFYDLVFRRSWGLGAVLGLVVLLAFLVAVAIRRGWRGALAGVVVMVIVVVLGGMMLPALSSSREKARRANTMSDLRQVGLSLSMFAEQHGGQLPATLEEAAPSSRVTVDTVSGEPFEYVGHGLQWQADNGRAVLAYSAGGSGGRNVLFSDGSVRWLRETEFQDALPFAGTGERHEHDLGGFTSETVAGDGSQAQGVNGPAPATSPAPTPPRAATRAPGEPGLRDLSSVLTPSAEASVLVPGGTGVLPVLAGIRPIHIEIPRTGQRFVFTKVLNVHDEPLAVRALAMRNDVFKSVRAGAQSLAFLVGLALLVWQSFAWRKQNLLIALGIALVLGGVGALLLSARLLDEAFIVGAPLLGLALLVGLFAILWKRLPPPKPAAPMPPPPGGEPGPSPVPPVLTAMLVTLLIGTTARAQSNTVSILSAEYAGVVRESASVEQAPTAQFTVVFELRAATPNQKVKLFGGEVAVQEFSGPSRAGGWFFFRRRPTDARLVRDGESVSVWLPSEGRSTVEVKFLVKLGGDVAKRQLAFGIPPALSTRLNVTLDEPEAVVELPTAVSFKTAPVAAAAGQTRVEAVLAAADRIELSWTPRTKKATEIAATVFCQNRSLVSLGGGLVNIRSILDYQVTQGELREVRVRLPVGQRLMRVEGESIRTWKLETEGAAQVLGVELLKGVSPGYRLTVETERMLDAPPVHVPVEIPHALDVKRETGLLALSVSDELAVTPEPGADLQKVDAVEFLKATDGPKAPATLPAGLSSAWRFLKPAFILAVQVEPVQPQVEVVVHHEVRIGTESAALRAVLDYAIKRAGVFALRMVLPADYRVEQVTGPAIAQWVERDPTQPGGPRILEVTLKERTLGAYQLQLDLVRLWRAMPEAVEVAGVQPLDTQKLSGFLAVLSEEGVQVKSETFEGMTEVPAATVGVSSAAAPGGSALAFKLIPAEKPAPEPGWKLTISTAKIESWVRAEIVHWITLTETLASGRSLVRYDIQNAPTREFRVKVPAGVKNVEIYGGHIRRRDEQDGEWRIELQNKVRGTYLLTVTWERPWALSDGGLELAGVEAVGVERETGALAVTAQPPLRVEPRTAPADLLKLDPRELPDWAGPSGDLPTVTYRYLRPGYRLALAAQRFEEAEVLQALVDRVQLTSVVAEDGQMMTEMSLSVRNNARQYLEVTLPKSATDVWAAFVAGQPVRPTVREGRLLLPLERSGEGGEAVAVELIYVSVGQFPRRRGAVDLESPALDLPLKNARWELYVPPDYEYADFDGSMKRELRADTPARVRPKVALFSLSDYEQVETKKKVAREAEVQSTITDAREQLKGGNLNDAWKNYRRARQSIGGKDLAQNEEFQKLEEDLRQGQARNLLEAQKSYTESNAMKLAVPGPQTQAAVQAPAPVQYDQKAAELQVAKVQQAQEIAVARALPLRVNLPKRGVHFSFTQVLQTEVKEPMTIQFVAVESRALGVPAVLGLAAVGLGGLWLLVAAVRRHRAV